MKNRILLLAVLSTLIYLKGFGQEEEAAAPTLSLSGAADVYFRTNFNASNDPTKYESGLAGAPNTSFANLPGFSLGMFNLIGKIDGAKVGAVGDLAFGPRGQGASFNIGPSNNIVNQLYAYWKVSDNVKFTFGKFNTFLGYEVISPTANFNYSTSYMFSWGPFSHTGLKMDISAGNFSVMGAIMNPTDYTDFNPTGDYVFGLQLGYNYGIGTAYANGVFQDGFYQLDLTAGADVTDNVHIGINTTVAQDAFSGFAGYLQVGLSDDFKLGVRAETFTDKGGGILGTPDASVFDLTFSANYKVGSLTLIPEFRIDSLSDAEFDLGDGDTGDSLSSFLLAAVYAF